MQLNERDCELAMGAERQNTIWATHVIECPKCTARLMFCRSSTPQIDACGFESYSLECEECGAPFAGIVDPCDDTLLLSEMAA
jgi:DNA-directed RNA polymerase subunit RPC12/RpoP